MKFSSLAEKYLKWCKQHRSENTYLNYKNCLDQFAPTVEDLDALDVKPYHLQEWLDSKDWSTNYCNSLIGYVKTVYNWGESQGYIEKNPISKMKRPPVKPRKQHITASVYEAGLKHIDASDPFRDIYIFLWRTGARPQEARHIEAHHVNLKEEYIQFSAEESKGKKEPRVIVLQGEALEIIARLVKKYPQGKLFRNNWGNPWTKVSLWNRYNQIGEKIGQHIFPYMQRHSWFTRKLKEGHDHLSLAAAGGHKDGTMISRVYGHLAEDKEYLKRIVRD